MITFTTKDLAERRRSEERLTRLNECFLGFTTEPQENINRLTALCGELMGGVCALYNKLDTGMLHTLAHWNAPPDFEMQDNADGHICHDVIKQGGDQLFCVHNLPESAYAETDPNVMRYALHSYIGMAVKCNGSYVGSLCVVYQKEFVPDDQDRKFMGILAVAVGVEEGRRIAAEQLRKGHEELEARVRERTAELARANEQLLIDIAERKRAEEALRKSEMITGKVFEAIPDLIAVIDKDLHVLHSNWHGGYEYVSQQIRDQSPYCYEAYYPGQKKPCDNCHTLEVFRTGKQVLTEKFNPHIGFVEVRAYPIFDSSGKVTMVAEYIRDITERKRMEEEVRKSHKLESLGILAGGIAHDFNNLLTGVLGNISLAKLTMNREEKTFMKLESAEKAAERARDLTQQLLTFSKGGAPMMKTASVERIVMDSASFVLRGSNVRCEIIIPSPVWPIEADEGQISQVINNLIINADQAMPEGGIITVTIENLPVGPKDVLTVKEGQYVKISVEDHGIGIASQHLEKIFDPYFTTKQKGSGLGLATVYSIIKNHGGNIMVESTVGIGTTFQIYLPASEKEFIVTNQPEENALSGSGKILIMDDEEILREVAAEILSHLGYRVAVCNEGFEAVSLYQEAMKNGDPFAAVIMDLTIPGGMGGKEAMQKLKELDSGVKGIVTSGYCNDPILANFREYGFISVVAKPYNLEELGKVLHDTLFSQITPLHLSRQSQP